MKNIYAKIVKILRAHKIFDVMLILLLGLHVFIGLKKGLLYIHGDSGIPLNPIKDLNLVYLWQNMHGGIFWWNLISIFQLAFFAVFEFVGLSLATNQHLFIYFAHTLAGVSMYFLTSSFQFKGKRIIAILSAIFYMFSPWLLNYQGIYVFLPYCVMPLILGLFVRGITGKMGKVSSSLLIMLFFFGIIINFPQFSMFAIAALLMFLYFLFFIFIYKKNVWPATKFMIILTVVLFLTSLWYILPFASYLSLTGVLKEMARTDISGSLQDFGDYGFSTILQLFRVSGAAGFMMGGAIYSEPYLNNLVILFINYLIPILAFSATLFRPKSKSVIFFSLIALIYIFIAKGVNAPFGQLHFLFVNNFPLARAFRTTWNLCLGANIAYAFLIAISVFEIAKRLSFVNRKNFIATIFIAAALILVNGWPLLTGDFFKSKWNLPSFEGLKIPPAYYQLENFLAKEKTDFHFLKIPKTEGLISTDWGYYGSDIYYSLFSTPFINGHPMAMMGREIINAAYSLLAENINRGEEAEKTLSLLNINRIVFDDYDGVSKPESKIEIPKKIDAHFEKEFDKFSIYKIDDYYFLPHFFIPKQFIYTDITPSNFADFISLPDYDIRSGIFSVDLEKENLEISQRPKKVIIKVEPTISLEDENKKTRTTDSLNPEAVYYPYARWKPGSLFYPLVLKREKLELKNSHRNPENYLNKHLFFASKRIFEIKKWGETLNINEWEKAGNCYYQLMEGALNELKKLYQQEDKSLFIYLFAKTRNTYYGHIDKMAVNFFDNKDSQYFEKETPMDKIFKKLKTEFLSLQKPPNVFSITYQFNIPKEDQYSLLVRDKNDYFQEAFFNFSKLTIDGQEIFPSNFEVENGIIKTIEKMHFKKGNHQLELSFSDLKNLLSNDAWQRQLPLYEATDDLLFFRFLKPLSPQEWMSAPQEIKSYTPSSYFFISFDYFVKDGNAGFAIYQDGDIEPKTGKEKPLVLPIMPPSKENVFQHYEGLFKSTNFKSAKIYLLAQQQHGKAADIKYKNVQIKPVFAPVFMFERNSSETTDLEKMPNITFTKINSTKYKVYVEKAGNPYYLVFSEGFHQGWKAYINQSPISNLKSQSNVTASYFNGEISEGEHKNIFLDKSTFETWGKTSLPEKRHFLTNGYANSWLIKPEDAKGKDTYEIIIEFLPQKMFYLGLGISLLTIIFCFGYLIFSKIFKL